jgi:hypothetical protein
VDASGDAWGVERQGERTLVLFGVPQASRALVAQEVWKTWRVSH